MAGIFQFACVQLYGFYISFLIVFFSSCATHIHLILVSGDDEVCHMFVSRAGMRPGGLVSILLLEHGVGHYQIELSILCQ